MLEFYARNKNLSSGPDIRFFSVEIDLNIQACWSWNLSDLIEKADEEREEDS